MRKQLEILMETCGEDIPLRQSVRRIWVLHHWPKQWVKKLDITNEEISRMAKRLISHIEG